MHHGEGRRITEGVHFFSKSLHRGGSLLPAQHLIAGKLVLELEMTNIIETQNSPATHNAVLAAADVGPVRGVEQVVGLVLQLLNVELPGLLPADEVGCLGVRGAPGNREKTLLLKSNSITVSFQLPDSPTCCDLLKV